jgi:hypothetical protein
LQDKVIECGADQGDAQSACDNLKKLEHHEFEYLKELIGLLRMKFQQFIQK